ncbi:MAG TPA: peptide-N4-asparagine amidase [Candidatus Acidoferrales bacterium]
MSFSTWGARFKKCAIFGLVAAGCAFAPVTLAQTAAAAAQAAASQNTAAGSAAAKPTVGSDLVATADPGVARPNTKHCEVTLLTDQAFDDFNNKDFSYTPPAGCRGPWAKVVFTGDFSIQPGVQFDRTGQLFFGGVNIYFGTTAEPLASETDTWHVERDLTDYTALFKTAQTGYASLGNIVGADGLNSIIFGTFKLEFYEADFFNPAPRTADQVLPVEQGGNPSFQITSTNTEVVQSFTLPKNVEAAYLDVIAQSQNAEEQWFFCVSNDIAAPLFDCGNTAFREVEITVDGKPAGAAPVYPWIYTGGLDPGLWVPIPGVQTLNLLPYRVDLTPFAGTLDDGEPHTVGVSVFNAYSYFTVTAQLLVYQDPRSKEITGAVTEDTQTAPAPVVTDTVVLDANGLGTGVDTVTNAEKFAISGYVNTSHGRVTTKVEQTSNFSSAATITSSATAYIQNNVNTSTTHVKVTTSEGPIFTTKETTFSYPITVNLDEEFLANGNVTEATSIDQKYEREVTDSFLGFPIFRSSVTNEVKPTDLATFVLTPNGYELGPNTDQSSSQTYIYNDSLGGCYNRTLTAAANVLTGVEDKHNCK